MFRFIPLLAGLIHLVIALVVPGTSTSWDLLVYNAILATTSIWLAVRRQWLLATAIGSWTLGSIYAAFVDLSGVSLSSSWGGIGYLVIYPVLFTYIIRGEQLRRLSRSQILDTLIITLGISALLATLALKATSNARSSSEIFLLILYPIGDALLIFLLILVGLRNGVSREYFILLLAITILTLSDVGYLWLFSNDRYIVGGLVDEGWLIALLLFSLLPQASQSTARSLNTYPAIFLALGLALSMLGWFAVNPNELSGVVLAIAIATLLLAFIRMALALEEAEQGKIHRELSATDELTGVGNRREFLSRLSQLPLDGSSTLLLLDLDGFKAINDQHGHAAGDGILREVAHRFRAALPAESYLARLGGDEFGVLIQRPVERSNELSARLERALSAPLYLGEESIDLSVSIGASSIDQQGNPLERADQQMYLAKRSAR